MPKELTDIKAFLEVCHRADARSVRVKKIPKRLSSGSVAIKTKLKVRCSRYLYTLVLDDEQKADKLAQSLSPSLDVLVVSKKKTKPVKK